MAAYDYECVNKQGQMSKGQITADNQSDAVERLKSSGLMVVEIKELKTRSSSGLFSSEKKVTLGELSIFSRQLSAMVNAGIPVTRALATLGRQAANPTFKAALENISKNVEGGVNLSDAFSSYPKIFSDLYISMIRAGEIGGMLETSLMRLADQLQKDKVLKDNIKSATFYPKVLAGFAFLMFFGMLIFLVPIFKGFIPQNIVLPLPTKIVFTFSDSIRGYWYIWGISAIAIFGGVSTFIKTPNGKYLWDKMQFKVPVFGELIHKSVVAKFSRTFSTLLEGGIPVVQALESAGPTSGSLMVSEAVVNAGKRIEEGKSISIPLEESGLFPPMVIQMISVGEETGSLPELLERVAEFYEEEVDTMTKGLSSMLEPIMLIFVGVVVGGMLISLYLPMFTAVTGK